MDVERSHLNPPLSCLCCGDAWRGSIIPAILQIAFHSMKHARVGPCFKNTPNVKGREITLQKIHIGVRSISLIICFTQISLKISCVHKIS